MIDVERWRLLRYDLPLHRPLTTGGGLRRTGLILQLTDGGATGCGEAAPIPGFHPGSDEAVAQQIEAALCHGEEPTDPVARFCIETAALDLAASQSGVRPAALLVADPAPAAPLNALIDSDRPAHQAQALATEGCTAVKIKVGRRDIDSEIASIKAVFEAAPRMRIRLDANRAWSLDDACRFCDALRGVSLDYLEEPLADPALLSDFYDRTGVPIGLDESLAEDHGGFPAGTAALVIKPTVVGGLTAALRLSAQAREIGAQAVISATFETSVGLAALTEIACATGPILPPQGLGTWRWLADDIVTERLIPEAFSLRWRRLTLRSERLR